MRACLWDFDGDVLGSSLFLRGENREDRGMAIEIIGKFIRARSPTPESARSLLQVSSGVVLLVRPSG